MDKPMAAVLSSAVSELLLLLIAAIISPPAGDSPINSLSPFLIHLLSISQTATTISILSNKRKRPELLESNKPTKFTCGTRQPELGAIPKNPDSFKICFKMNSSTFEWLSGLLEPLLECRDPLDSPLNLRVETRLGIGLFRLATGSDYAEVSRRFEVSEPVAKFCVNQLCRVLCTNFRFWVGFPTQNELDPVTEAFETVTGLPNCCGVIHCTRFKIHEHESIAAQLVVDSSLKILSIVAGFNGKKGNQLVLKLSSLYKDIESNSLLNDSHIDINGVSIPQYLIGDQGYPLLPWLMVPFEQPVANSYQSNFNSVHNLMLSSGFRTVDSLKKWGVLNKPINEEIKTMVAYIGSCSILHNALLMREDYSSLSEKCDDYLGEYRIDASVGDSLVEQKAFQIRSVLATRARKC